MTETDPFALPEEDQKPVERLDESQPYGTVQGDDMAKYFQDGKFYNYAKVLITEGK